MPCDNDVQQYTVVVFLTQCLLTGFVYIHSLTKTWIDVYEQVEALENPSAMWRQVQESMNAINDILTLVVKIVELSEGKSTTQTIVIYTGGLIYFRKMSN